MSDFIFKALVIILLLEFVFERLLSYLNRRNWSEEIPEAFRGIFDAEKYKEARAYSAANYKTGIISSTVSLLIMLTALFFGWFGLLDQWVNGITENPVLRALLFFGIIGLASGIISLPFSLYHTFVIEERFGFNKTDLKTFVLDLIKSMLLSAVLGAIILGIIVWLYLKLGADFWWAAWLVVAAFMVFMMMFYSNLIVPLFNKQKPLEEGPLRDAIQEFAAKVGFKLDNIYVIDGSRRSTKANAYFTGLGAKKRIVLYDTLIEGHSVEELVAVLAHEIGHYKKKHTVQSLILGLLQTGLLFYLLSLFIAPGGAVAQAAAEALQAQPNFQIGVLVFGILYTPLSTLLGIFMNYLSRRNEFQADAFAREHYSGKALSEALLKMSVKHLSNLNPHPAYVFVHYSHPPLIQRLQALQS